MRSAGDDLHRLEPLQRQIVLSAQSRIDRVAKLGLEADQVAEQLLEILHQSDSDWDPRAALVVGRDELSTAQRLRAQRVVHYATGAGIGAAYGATGSRWAVASRGRGIVAGLGIYALTHGSILPAVGIQRPPWRLAPAAVTWEMTSHAIFGAALEAMRRLARASR